MNRSALILGCGRQARVVVDLVRENGYTDLRLFDPEELHIGTKILGVRVVGTLHEFLDIAADGDAFLAFSSNAERAFFFRLLTRRDLNLPALIHPSAIVSSEAVVKRGVHLCQGAHVAAGASVGEDSILGTGALVDYDAVVGEHCFMGPSTTLGQGASMRDFSRVENNATVTENWRIGRNAVIGAGAVVKSDVEDGVVVGGGSAQSVHRNEPLDLKRYERRFADVIAGNSRKEADGEQRNGYANGKDREPLSAATIPDNENLGNAMRKISRFAQPFIFVVGAQGRMVGLLTDGDIRRWLVGGGSLGDSVTDVMKRDFFSLPYGSRPKEIYRHFSSRYRVIPLLDEIGRLVDYAYHQPGHYHIPSAQPDLTGNELRYVTECMITNWISSQGEFIGRFESMVAAFCGSRHALAVSNGTVALHLTLAAMGIGPGDEVIVPAFTFAATAAAVCHTGARPVFVDVEEDTWCIDPKGVESRITPRTRAIIPVHLYGQSARMEPILRISTKYDLKIVEDAAEAMGAEHKGHRVGSLGNAGCFSFFANKIVTTGEGGMIVTDDSALWKKCRMLRDHGMDPERRYWHVTVGYNYRMTNLQAAIGVAQMEQVDKFLKRRDEIGRLYREELGRVPGLRFRPESTYGRRVRWLTSLMVDKEVFGMSRDDLISELKTRGIDLRAVFQPLPNMPPYRDGYNYPVSSRLGITGLSLPSSPSLKDEDVERICKEINSLSSGFRPLRKQGTSRKMGIDSKRHVSVLLHRISEDQGMADSISELGSA